MRRNKLVNIFTVITVFILFYSCKKTEEFTSEPVSDYMPLTVGKYITYRIDSTVFTNLGRNEEIHRYQVKHEVDAQITDNLGRPSFRIIRYLRDSIGTKPWTVSGTYFATPFNDQVEIIEDNLRFIKLHIPITLDFTWKGNKYLTNNPYLSLFVFNNDDKMNNWDYRYDTFEPTTTIGGQAVNNVYTIPQVDESLNAPVTSFNSYGARNFAVEKYSKNIGLVYRENILWEYQPNAGGGGVGYKTGFGLKMWMIDHN